MAIVIFVANLASLSRSRLETSQAQFQVVATEVGSDTLHTHIAGLISANFRFSLPM